MKNINLKRRSAKNNTYNIREINERYPARIYIMYIEYIFTDIILLYYKLCEYTEI